MSIILKHDNKYTASTAMRLDTHVPKNPGHATCNFLTTLYKFPCCCVTPCGYSDQTSPLLSVYLDAWAQEDPGLKFLEIGAGTGASTSMILDVVANLDHGPRYAEYMFTDISSFFFLKAQERFATYNRVHYRRE